MSPIYTSPGTRAEVIPNPRLISLAEGIRVPAVVGFGPTRVIKGFDTPYQVSASGSNSAGWTDELPFDNVKVYEVSTTFSFIGKSGSAGYENNLFTGISSDDYSGDIWNSLDSEASNNLSDFEVTGSIGNIVWFSNADNGDGISIGNDLNLNAYYIHFSADVPATQYDATLFVDKVDIRAKYGGQQLASSSTPDGGATCGVLTVAGSMALEEGSPAIWLVQAATNDVAGYKTAIDKLKKINGINYVLSVFPSGSWSQTDVDSVHAYMKSHAEQMSQDHIMKERQTAIGDLWTGVSTGGSSGRAEDEVLSTYTGKAETYSSKRVTYAAPVDLIQRPDDSGRLVNLDGNYMQVAHTAKISAQEKVKTPVTGGSFASFSMPNNKYEETEMDILAAAGVSVFYSVDGLVKIRHSISTDPTNADTQELSVIEQENLVKRISRDKLNQAFIGKGITVDENTPSNVASTLEGILRTLVANKEIFAYGTKNDPATGETPITAFQDSVEPRRIQISASVKFLYPLNWISLTFSLYV